MMAYLSITCGPLKALLGPLDAEKMLESCQEFTVAKEIILFVLYNFDSKYNSNEIKQILECINNKEYSLDIDTDPDLKESITIENEEITDELFDQIEEKYCPNDYSRRKIMRLIQKVFEGNDQDSQYYLTIHTSKFVMPLKAVNDPQPLIDELKNNPLMSKVFAIFSIRNNRSTPITEQEENEYCQEISSGDYFLKATVGLPIVRRL